LAQVFRFAFDFIAMEENSAEACGAPTSNSSSRFVERRPRRLRTIPDGGRPPRIGFSSLRSINSFEMPECPEHGSADLVIGGGIHLNPKSALVVGSHNHDQVTCGVCQAHLGNISRWREHPATLSPTSRRYSGESPTRKHNGPYAGQQRISDLAEVGQFLCQYDMDSYPDKVLYKLIEIPLPDEGPFLSDGDIEYFGRSCKVCLFTPPESDSLPPLTVAPISGFGERSVLKDVSGVSVKGVKTGVQVGSQNQDALSFCVSATGVEVYLVCDGHGPDGHLCSARVARTLPCFLVKAAADGLSESVLTNAFSDCHEDLLSAGRAKEFDVVGSGTTVAAVVRQGHRTWVASTGDSRVVIGSRPGTERGPANLELASMVHRPEDEEDRIYENGAEVIRVHTTHRIFLEGEDWPGLNVSRCLGHHVLARSGVTIPTPAVQELAPCSRGRKYFAVLGTDGVFATVQPETLCDLDLPACHRPHDMVDCIHKEAHQPPAGSDLDTSDARFIDDTTIVVVAL